MDSDFYIYLNDFNSQILDFEIIPVETFNLNFLYGTDIGQFVINFIMKIIFLSFLSISFFLLNFFIILKIKINKKEMMNLELVDILFI